MKGESRWHPAMRAYGQLMALKRSEDTPQIVPPDPGQQLVMEGPYNLPRCPRSSVFWSRVGSLGERACSKICSCHISISGEFSVGGIGTRHIYQLGTQQSWPEAGPRCRRQAHLGEKLLRTSKLKLMIHTRKNAGAAQSSQLKSTCADDAWVR